MSQADQGQFFDHVGAAVRAAASPNVTCDLHHLDVSNMAVGTDANGRTIYPNEFALVCGSYSQLLERIAKLATDTLIELDGATHLLLLVRKDLFQGPAYWSVHLACEASKKDQLDEFGTALRGALNLLIPEGCELTMQQLLPGQIGRGRDADGKSIFPRESKICDSTLQGLVNRVANICVSWETDPSHLFVTTHGLLETGEGGDKLFHATIGYHASKKTEEIVKAVEQSPVKKVTDLLRPEFNSLPVAVSYADFNPRTVQAMRAAFQAMFPQEVPQHFIFPSMAWVNIVGNDVWVQLMDPVSKYEMISNGQIGYSLGLVFWTDAFEHPELRWMKNDDYFMIGNKGSVARFACESRVPLGTQTQISKLTPEERAERESLIMSIQTLLETANGR